jgi:ADP-ribose pyrophosphatase
MDLKIMQAPAADRSEELFYELKDTEWPEDYISHDRRIARGIVCDDEGRFYFVRVNRDDLFGKAMHIETPGGGVEDGEELATAIRRELGEELGIEVEIICRLGLVSDYYNVIHRHNLTNYFLCRIVSFGDSHMTEDEANIFHLSKAKLTFDEAVAEYEQCRGTAIGRLIANRELPMLLRAKEILDGMRDGQ